METPMVEARHRSKVAATALLLATLTLPACAGGAAGTPHGTAAPAAALEPGRIIPAPAGALAAAQPQPDGTLWVLADGTGRGGRVLYRLSMVSGKVLRTIKAGSAAQSVAQSGLTLAVALDTGGAGTLAFIASRTGKVVRSAALAGPPRQVVAGGDGRTFDVLTTVRSGAAVSLVDSGTGRVTGTVAVPRDAVSAVPDGQGNLYVLQRSGHISEVAVPSGQVEAVFPVGDPGISLAISPGGTTLYALKGTAGVANVGVVDAATESMREALPAPADCRQVLVSSDGRQLYDVVGTGQFGNIQVYPATAARSGQR
jgi:hypothetical protein